MDLKNRLSAAELDFDTFTQSMRKAVRMGDVTVMIEQLHSQTLGLKAMLAENERIILKERRREEHIQRVKKLVTNKLDFNRGKAFKR